MDAQLFKDTYINKIRNGFVGPEITALVGVPSVDGSGRTDIQIDVPGMGVNDAVRAVGVYGASPNVTDPAALEAMDKYGLAPYKGAIAPPRSLLGTQFEAPAHPTFNREATEQYMPGVMKGIGPGMMPVIR